MPGLTQVEADGVGRQWILDRCSCVSLALAYDANGTDDLVENLPPVVAKNAHDAAKAKTS